MSELSMQHCPNCSGGELKIVAAILERPVIQKILTVKYGNFERAVEAKAAVMRRDGEALWRCRGVAGTHPREAQPGTMV